MPITIAEATTPAEIGHIRALVRDYARWLEADHGISLTFQNIEAELAALPGKYARPEGALRLAKTPDGAAVGCIALRPHEGVTGEIKRLFVAPDVRGGGLGSRLIDDIITLQRIDVQCGALGMFLPLQAIKCFVEDFDIRILQRHLDQRQSSGGDIDFTERVDQQQLQRASTDSMESQGQRGDGNRVADTAYTFRRG